MLVGNQAKHVSEVWDWSELCVRSILEYLWKSAPLAKLTLLMINSKLHRTTTFNFVLLREIHGLIAKTLLIQIFNTLQEIRIPVHKIDLGTDAISSFLTLQRNPMRYAALFVNIIVTSIITYLHWANKHDLLHEPKFSTKSGRFLDKIPHIKNCTGLDEYVEQYIMSRILGEILLSQFLNQMFHDSKIAIKTSPWRCYTRTYRTFYTEVLKFETIHDHAALMYQLSPNRVATYPSIQ